MAEQERPSSILKAGSTPAISTIILTYEEEKANCTGKDT
jgi:hypothetical protein